MLLGVKFSVVFLNEVLGFFLNIIRILVVIFNNLLYFENCEILIGFISEFFVLMIELVVFIFLMVFGRVLYVIGFWMIGYLFFVCLRKFGFFC